MPVENTPPKYPPPPPPPPYASAYLPFRKYSPPPRPRFDYSGLIKQTLALAWRHRFLWFFGLFAWGSTTSFGWSANFGGSWREDSGAPDPSPADSVRWIQDHTGLLVAIAVTVMMIALIIWLWSIVCRGAVIGATEEIREARPAGFSVAWRRGRESFGRLLLFDLFLIGLALGLIVIIAALATLIVFLVASGGVGQAIVGLMGALLAIAVFGLLIAGFGFLTCFTIWFALAVPYTLVMIYATRAVVLDGKRPLEALRTGWRLMMATLSRSLLVYLLSTGLGIIAGIALFISLLVSGFPAIIAWIATGANDWPFGGILLAGALSAVPLIVLLLAIALVNTYFTAFWTIVYRKLRGVEAEPGLPPSGYPLQPHA